MSLLFKIEWYNTFVDNRFKLNHDPNTFAVLVISTPSMFESTFLPFLFRKFKNDPESLTDPIDKCMVDVFDTLKNVKFLETIR